MQTKLTLRMDKDLIERVKKHAAENDTSLSRMVAEYFRLVVGRRNPEEGENDDWKSELGPITRSLVGIAKGADVTEEDYRRYLEEKHR